MVILDKLLNRLPLQDKALFISWTGVGTCEGMSRSRVAKLFSMSEDICGAIIDRIVREFSHPSLRIELGASDPRIVRAVNQRFDDLPESA